MSMFDFPEEGSDYYSLKREISELKDKVNSLPIQIEGTNLGFSPSVLVPQSAGSTVAGGGDFDFVTEWGEIVGDYVTDGLTSLKQFADDFFALTGDSISAKLGAILSGFTDSLADFLDMRDTASDGTVSFKAEYADGLTVKSFLDAVLDNLGFEATYDEDADYTQFVTRILDGLFATTTDIATRITNKLGDAWTNLETFIGDIESTASAWLQASVTDIETALGTAWANLKTFGAGIVSSASAWLEARGTEIQTALGDAWTNLNSLLTEIGSNAVDWLEARGTEIQTALGDAWTNLETFVGDITSTAATWLEARGTEIKSALSTAWVNLERFAGDITTSASDWLEARGTEIQTALGDAWTDVNNLVTEIGSDISEWLEARGTEIQTALGTTYSRLVTFGAGITTSASAWLQARGADIQTALGDAWVNVNNLVTEIGSDAADWLEEQSAEIVTALSAAGNTAWTWLQALLGPARNFLTGITGTIHSTLDRIAGWVGTASTALAWVADTLSAGATNLVDAAIAVLFDDKTQYVFAQDEAGTKITSELGSSGDITAKIGAEITDAWEDFWVDLGETAHGVNTSLTTILSDIADFFTSGSTTTDDTKATKALDNLSSVSINKPLKFASVLNTPTPNYSLWRVGSNMEIRTVSSGDFNVRLGDDILFKVGTPTTAELPVVPLIVEDDGVTINEALLIGQNTNPGLTSRGIGADNTGNLYFKTPTFDGHWYFQNNGGSSNRTEFEILNQAIKIGEDNNSASDPTGNGEIKRVGDTLKVYVDGGVKDFADIGGGSGSGANAELSNLESPTSLNEPLTFQTGTRPALNDGGIGVETDGNLYFQLPSVSGDSERGFITYIDRRFGFQAFKYRILLPTASNTPTFTKSNGSMWYNTTDNKFKFYQNGSEVELGGGGGGGGSGYVEGDSPTFNDIIATDDITAQGDLTVQATTTLAGQLNHTGNTLGFFNTSNLTSQENWTIGSNVRPSDERKLTNPDGENEIKSVVNGLIDRLHDLGLINLQ